MDSMEEGGTFVFHLARAAAVAPLAAVMGGLSQRLRLPRITGYLIAGILCGPYVLDVITEDAVRSLWPVDFVCLSTIAVAAGSELQISELHQTKKQVLYICFGICIVTYTVVYSVMFLASPFVPATQDMPASQLHAFCSLCGCLMMARSPASAIAVIKEFEARGPFTNLVMAVVVVKDVMVIMAFALNMELCRIVFSKDANATLTVGALMEPVLSLVASLCLGVAGAGFLGLVLKPKGFLSGMIGPTRGHRLQGAVVVVGNVALFAAAEALRSEPLLACVVMGLVATNRKYSGSDRERENLHWVLSAVMPVTNVPFFALAGASLKMTALMGTVWLGALVYAVRLLAIWVGSTAGASLGGSAPEHGRHFWLTMVTQAGVAMGLAKTCAVRFPGWGDDFVTLMAGVIILNLLTGPPMFKTSLVKIGEARNTEANLLSSAEADADYNYEHEVEEGRTASPKERDPSDTDAHIRSPSKQWDGAYHKKPQRISSRT